MRHTKIIATVGPASSSTDVLHALVEAGVDVFRLNFSHGTHESHAECFDRIRTAAARANRLVAIMQDLSGPKIRTGPLNGDPLMLKEGEPVILGAGARPGDPGPPIRIFTQYAELVGSAKPGDRLLLDDGRIELKVVSASPDELTTEVVHGGLLAGKKGINAPGVALPPSALTPKDVDDLQFGLSLGVDLVALSFVQTPDDVLRAREIIDRSGRATPVIAKIERPAAVTNLEAILHVVQGVMVARGDLGLEMPLEQVPRVQKEIIRCARMHSMPAIVATQVLESMRVEPRPTRAEVSDAANAVEEGADAIMLAGETAAGAFPIKAVQMLDAVIRDAELMPSVIRRDARGRSDQQPARPGPGGSGSDARRDVARRRDRRGDVRRQDRPPDLRHAARRADSSRSSGRDRRRPACAPLGRGAVRDGGARGRAAQARPPCARPRSSGLARRLHQREPRAGPSRRQLPARLPAGVTSCAR